METRLVATDMTTGGAAPAARSTNATVVPGMTATASYIGVDDVSPCPHEARQRVGASRNRLHIGQSSLEPFSQHVQAWSSGPPRQHPDEAGARAAAA